MTTRPEVWLVQGEQPRYRAMNTNGRDKAQRPSSRRPMTPVRSCVNCGTTLFDDEQGTCATCANLDADSQFEHERNHR